MLNSQAQSWDKPSVIYVSSPLQSHIENDDKSFWSNWKKKCDKSNLGEENLFFCTSGRPISDAEAGSMVGEAPGPVNFTQMVTLFAEKMSGGKYLK